MKSFIASIIAAFVFVNLHGQVDTTIAHKTTNELKYNLSADGSKYVKFTFLNQLWLRGTETNPGTTVNGATQENIFDIGLRRTRMQLYGQLNEHAFFYMQFGMNNFNFLSQNSGNRKLQAFFHDALGEYVVFKKSNALKLGGGLTIVNGFSRFSQPGVGTIMTTDVPVFLQATVDQTDEFSRKLSVYARGQVGKIDCRVALSDPFNIETNGQPVPQLGSNSTFAPSGHTKQYQAFVMYNILEREPHTTPYMAGTYLGGKKIFNIEAGVTFQENATWRLDKAGQIEFNNMLLWSLAAFIDMPVMDNKYAVSGYAGYFGTDYGEGYIRNNGIMNPANGTVKPTAFGGWGNSYPMFGTGNSLYAQIGFRLPNDMFKENGTLMPYVSYRTSQYDRLRGDVNVWDGGVNWLMNKHSSKLSLNYQLRPLYTTLPAGEARRSGNASSVWLQYQLSI